MSIVSMMDEAAKEAAESGKGCLMVMDPKEGDIKTVWDKTVPEEVDHARDTFKKFKRKGMACFRVNKDGTKAEQVHEFDPDAESLIMAPAPRGG